MTFTGARKCANCCWAAQAAGPAPLQELEAQIREALLQDPGHAGVHGAACPYSPERRTLTKTFRAYWRWIHHELQERHLAERTLRMMFITPLRFACSFLLVILTLHRPPRLAGDQHCDITHRLASAMKEQRACRSGREGGQGRRGTGRKGQRRQGQSRKRGGPGGGWEMNAKHGRHEILEEDRIRVSELTPNMPGPAALVDYLTNFLKMLASCTCY